VIALLAEVLPQASRHDYGGAGHMPQGTHPEEHVEATARFMLGADDR